MRVSVSWLREYVDAPHDPEALEAALVRVGLEVEQITDLRDAVTGPLVVGRVVELEELTGLKKPIRYCQVEVGESTPRGIICGATNFGVGDLVVVALPGAVLPGDFAISARKTYGRVSDGMICSERELGLGDDHSGIIVLPREVAIGPGVDPVSVVPGADARPLIGLDDIVVELAVTPDRGYCFSVRGIARELAHALQLPFTDPADHPAPGATAEPAWPVTVDDPTGCDRFATRLVRGIDPAAPTPAWMRRRLLHSGVRPLGLAVDITNYLMLELGQPMHAFDPDRLTGGLLVRRAHPGEKLTTLDGVARVLDAEDMVICDDRGPVSLAAVMGGANSEMTDDSVNVLFEAAHWDPVMVARTARRHKLPSEAVKRFERGVDPQLPLVALQRAVELLTRYAGGEIDPRIGDVDTTVAPEPITITADLPGRIAGVDYSPQRVTELLTGLGATVEPQADGQLRVTPPSWRPDLTDPADLVEEVARLDGYDRIPSVLPTAPPGSGLTAAQRRRRTVSRALAEAGYVETRCYPFVGETDWEAFRLPSNDPRRQVVRLANPLSEEQPALRTTLLPPLLATLRRNLSRLPGGSRDLALYELGVVFHPRQGEGDAPARLRVDRRPSDDELTAAQQFVPDQPWHVAAVITGAAEPAGWWGSGRPADWADAVAAARDTLAAAGVADERVGVQAAEYAPWHPGRCAVLLVDQAVVGHAGELHPAVCDALELPRRTCAMELNLDAVPLPTVVSGPAVSSYPPTLIDVALQVDEAVAAADVHQALVDGAGELLESARLFDVYTGEQLGAGRKSLAYKLTFRAPDRTLTGEEAVAARDAAVAEAARRLGAELRGG
jgi:phenylalanyl-tRNA synthetase beta chain